MNTSKTALVLGGTAAHIALINELKARAYRTILVDYYENPVAAQYADEHVRESTMDKEKVLEVAKERHADLVISACVDQANVIASYAMEGIGKRPPYPYSTAMDIADKAKMKEVMLSNGIPTAKHIYTSNSKVPDISDLAFPLMVKPTDCCGAAGVKRCDNYEQLEKHLPFALDCSRTHQALIEEHVDGVEASAYCFISNGKATVLATAERLSVSDGTEDVIKCYGTIMPSSLGQEQIEAIREAADLIASVYQLDNTPLHVQAIFDGGRMNIIEFAPRVGGGLSYLTIRKRTGFDMISATVDSWEGNKVEVSVKENDVLQVVHLVYGHPGVFDHIGGCDALMSDGTIDHFFEYKTPGMQLGTATASAGRAGAFTISGVSCEEVAAKVAKAFNQLKVVSDAGQDLTRRDLVLDASLAGYSTRLKGGACS